MEDPDKDFLALSSVSYFIPSQTNFNLEKKLKEATESGKHLLSLIDQRKSLFFGG